MIFWKNTIFKNKKIKNILISESFLIDLNAKKLKIIEEFEIAENKKKIENSYSSLDDGDWSSYKKKNSIIFGDFRKKIKIKKKINIYLINKNKKLLTKLKNNFFLLGVVKQDNHKFNNNKSIILSNYLFNYYNKINVNKLKIIKDNLYFKNFEKKIIIIIDIKTIKPKIIAIYKEKCILTVTTGIVFNKLRMKEKKAKKTQKMFNLMLKLVILNVKNKIKLNNFIVHIKGTKSRLSNLVLIIKKNFNTKSDNLVFIYSPLINYKLKFKKIKSIKRRLKKKIVRFK